MTILMGGSGSTGSSMLRQVLNRHPDIFSGTELNFFNKELLFENWNQSKKKIFRKKPYFTTKGWVSYPGSNLLNEDYLWEKNDLKQLIISSDNIVSFSEAFFKKPLDVNNAKFWIEKTPSNAYSFSHFLKKYPRGKVIHSTRNPFDAIASLINRGFTPIYAAGMWIYNSASAISVTDSNRYMEIKYEELVENPELITKKLLKFIKIPFIPEILKPEENKHAKKLTSWGNDPNRKISKSSIGRYESLNIHLKQEIISALSVFRISEKHINQKNLTCSNCEEVCNEIGYEFKPRMFPKYEKKIKRDLKKDFLQRSVRFYSTGWNFYPGTLEWTYV